MKTVNQRIEELTPKAIHRWGVKAQMVKTCEEMSELTQQLCKKVNGSPSTPEAMIDELADVLIMVKQMALCFGVKEVEARAQYKLDRLEKVLNDETANPRL